jgi:hypothetical protein
LIKIREDPSGKVSMNSSVKEEVREGAEYPLMIRSESIKHSIFVIRKV